MTDVKRKSWPLSWPGRLGRAVDPYVAALLGTVALAALLPASGGAATAVGHTADIAIGLLFFLYGSRLSTREALSGLRQWRLHLVVAASTFALFPLLGVAAGGLAPFLLTDRLTTGLLFLCVVPSTVQSSVALTSTARGNVPAAICAGTYSSLLGMVATPLLAAWLIGSDVRFSADGLLAIATQLLLPFLAGQALRRWTGAFIGRHKKALALLDRGSILLVVYTAFSRGMTEGVWHQITPARLCALLGLAAALLGLALTTTSFTARRLGFSREDRVTIVFCGSNKSLATGLPMAAVLFGDAAGPVILPLMLFHQLQLMVCAVIAGRWSRRAPEAALAPGEQAQVTEVTG
ncbi:bile acid:sodium symporter family protein [Streptomyces hygroscopicus]|uniref:bile acid:sodium symporter family protein n=1 Tax=Streptomyces hygroscopicus TaxID=1912 RepID=UPI000A56A258|nr:bile acid:sodium symporter family protein [Streptomyces hygroscopicus]GLV79130.1 bile acid:sodium symporter [Streptomyces hygroscopicus subsp. hygroscopicus]